MFTAPWEEIAIGSAAGGSGLGDVVGTDVAATGDAVAGVKAGVGLSVDVHPPTIKVITRTTRRARQELRRCIT